jgi:hypothetical protein
MLEPFEIYNFQQSSNISHIIGPWEIAMKTKKDWLNIALWTFKVQREVE